MADDHLPLGALALLAAAVLLGGGHIQGPLRNGLIESGAFSLLLLLLNRQCCGAVLPSSAQVPLAVTLSLLGLTLFQLIPLPPAWAPDGRDATDAVRALAAAPLRWHPLSLDPAATSRFAASLIVPVAMALATIATGQRGRIALLRAIVLLALASAALGMVQLALGYPAWASPFGKPEPGVADGLFVNRNHQGLFLLIGIVATGLLIGLEGPGSGSPWRISAGRRWRIHGAWLVIPLLALMTIAAGSRAGVGLLAVALPAAIALGLRTGPQTHQRKLTRTAMVIAFGLLLLALVLAFVPIEPMASFRNRLVFHGDTRLEVLPDLIVLLRQYWPWGSGLGSFVPVYKTIEDLDKLGPAYLNHAHDEYLEWLIETGLVGALVLLAIVVAFVARLVSVIGSARSDSRKALALGGAAMILLVAIHSAVDYPLRTDAHAAMFGVAIGLLFTPGIDAPSAPREVMPRRRPISLLMALLGIAVAGQILRLRLVESAAGDANGGLALAVPSHDGFAEAYAAEALLVAGQPAAARARALAAIDRSPLSIGAVRTLAMAEARLGDPISARNAWRAAAGLGWRDLPTQYWALRQALAEHQPEIAGMRADALLRLNNGAGPFATLAREALVDPALRAALVARMALRPTWRAQLFYTGGPLTATEVAGLEPTLHVLQRTAAPPSRNELRGVMEYLLARGDFGRAWSLYEPLARFMKRDPGSLIDDGDFNRTTAQYQSDATPFDWQMLSVGANSIALDEATPRAMVVTSDGAEAGSPLRRWVALRPGRYRLSYGMKGTPDSADAVGVWVQCLGSPAQLGEGSRELLRGTDFDPRFLDFTVPAGCPAVQINLGGLGGQSGEGEFDHFRLARLP